MNAIKSLVSDVRESLCAALLLNVLMGGKPLRVELFSSVVERCSAVILFGFETESHVSEVDNYSQHICLV